MLGARRGKSAPHSDAVAGHDASQSLADGPRLLAELRESERKRALERFDLLRPCLEDGVPLARLAREHEIQLRTLQRWLRAYRQNGLVGLVRKSLFPSSASRKSRKSIGAWRPY
jgi:hypothetical protein